MISQRLFNARHKLTVSFAEEISKEIAVAIVKYLLFPMGNAGNREMDLIANQQQDVGASIAADSLRRFSTHYITKM